MLVNEEDKIPIKRLHNKFVPRLSQEEKDFIEKISGLTGLKFNTVKDTFLAISTATALDMYSNKNEVVFPFLFKVKVNMGSSSSSDSYQVEPFLALRNIIDKIHSHQSSWLEDYFKTQIRNLLFKILDVKEE